MQEFEIKEFHVGGTRRLGCRFKEGHPIAGSEIANSFRLSDITPENRIVTTTKMSLNGKPILVAVLTLKSSHREPEQTLSSRIRGRTSIGPTVRQ